MPSKTKTIRKRHQIVFEDITDNNNNLQEEMPELLDISAQIPPPPGVVDIRKEEMPELVDIREIGCHAKRRGKKKGKGKGKGEAYREMNDEMPELVDVRSIIPPLESQYNDEMPELIDVPRVKNQVLAVEKELEKDPALWSFDVFLEAEAKKYKQQQKGKY